MKKLILSATVLVALTIVSCKKANRVCECTTSDGTISYKLTDKTTKGEAKAVCVGYKTKDSDGTEEPAQEPGTTCKLK